VLRRLGGRFVGRQCGGKGGLREHFGLDEPKRVLAEDGSTACDVADVLEDRRRIEREQVGGWYAI
jgi:hypothetical protein